MANQRIWQQTPSVGPLAEDRVVPHENDDGTSVTEKGTMAQLRGTLVPGYDDGNLTSQYIDVTAAQISAGSMMSDDGTMLLTTLGTERIDSTVTGLGGFSPTYGSFEDLWAYFWVLGDSTGVFPTAVIAVHEGVDPLLEPSASGYDKKRYFGNNFIEGFSMRQMQNFASPGVRYSQIIQPGSQLRALTGGTALVSTPVAVAEAGVYQSGLNRFSPPGTQLITVRCTNSGSVPAVISSYPFVAAPNFGQFIVLDNESIVTDIMVDAGTPGQIYYFVNGVGAILTIIVQGYYTKV